MPDVIIIAGPNGAGKSTILPTIRRMGAGNGPFEPNQVEEAHVIDPDQIARDGNLGPIDAGRLAIKRTRQLIKSRVDFAIETTLVGNRVLRLIDHLQDEGYRVYLVYLWLPDAELSVARVVQRGLRGRHYIPLPILLRRYQRSMANFVRASTQADFWVAVDNSSLVPKISAWGGRLFANQTLSRDRESVLALKGAIQSCLPMEEHDPVTNKLPWGEIHFDAEIDVITPLVLERIRRAVIAEIQRQPQECVCVWEEGRLGFREWRLALSVGPPEEIA